MTKYQAVAIFVTGIFFVTACTKEISIDIPHTPMLAVNMSNLTGNDGKLYLQGSVSETKRTGSSSYGYNPVNNALVSLYDGNDLLEILWPDTLFFSGTYRTALGNLQENKKYTLKIKAEGFADVEAEDVMPARVPVTAVLTPNAKEFVIPEYGAGVIMCDEITLTFNDAPATTDYYGITLNRGTNADGFLLYDKDAELGKGETSPDQMTVLHYGTFFYKDVNFNGEQKIVTLYFPVDDTKNEYYLRFNHLSENLYKYQRSFEKYKATNENPFADPVQIFSNIKNGVGIFGLQQVVKDTLSRLQQPTK